MTTKPCVICGAPARVAEPDDAALCSAGCFYTLEAELDRPIAGERLIGDTLTDVRVREQAVATTAAWPPPIRPGSEGCTGCGGYGIVAVTDTVDESWLTQQTPPDQWRPCLVCQPEG